MPPCPVRCGKSRRRVRARRRGALVCASCCPTLSIVRSTTSHREPACGFSSWRPDCVAGHVRLELRNVGAKYPFERSHRFPGSSRVRASETIRVRAAPRGHSSGLNLVPLYCSTPRPNSHPAKRKSTRLQCHTGQRYDLPLPLWRRGDRRVGLKETGSSVLLCPAR